MRILVISIVFIGSIFLQDRLFAQSKPEVEKEADALFRKEKYVEATPLYLRLLSLEPRDANYNYRYGTCLLYNSDNKSSAFKYLNYAVSVGGVDNEAYFFLGKAYHLTFQFNKAIANYSKYQELAGDKAIERLNVNRQIEMCVNAKSLISNISELVVVSKKQVDYTSFFRLYDLSNIGGTLLITEEFQSKTDRKENHLPLIHYPSEPKRIYYSSYGDKENGDKDIYMRTRLPDNTWSLPRPVFGQVNTPYDEDYPYMHPDGKYLYFCSKGHNSMGGYDIFRSKFNPDNNSFDAPENMDYAISSPDNDLFYVVDSLNKYAYFASQRESEDGKVHVYEVRVERFPVQIVIIKGEFTSVVNPDNKDISIEVYSASTEEQVGKFKTDRRGGYLINLPKGGRYEFKVTVGEGGNQYKQIIDVPYLKEFKPLKQKIDELALDDGKTVKITNLFNEEFDDPGAVMAEIIQKKAQLVPNSEDYDLDSLDQIREANKVLAQIGLGNFTELELIDVIKSKSEDLSLKEENLKTAINQNQNRKARLTEEVNTLYATIESKLKEAESDLNQNESGDLFSEIANDLKKLQVELNKIVATEIVEKALETELAKTTKNLEKVNELKTAYNEAESEGKNKVLLLYKDFVQVELLKEDKVEVSSVLSPKLAEQINSVNKANSEISQLKSEIKAIENRVALINEALPDAKKKEKQALNTALSEKEIQLITLKEELQYQENVLRENYSAAVLESAKRSLNDIKDESKEEVQNNGVQVNFTENELSSINDKLAVKIAERNNSVNTAENISETVSTLVETSETYSYDLNEKDESQEVIEQKIETTEGIIKEIDEKYSSDQITEREKQVLSDARASLAKGLEERKKLVSVADTDLGVSSEMIKNANKYDELYSDMLDQYKKGVISVNELKEQLSPYYEELNLAEEQVANEIKEKGNTSERSKKKKFIEDEKLSVERDIAMLDRISNQNKLKEELAGDLLKQKAELDNEPISLENIERKLSLVENIGIAYEDELELTQSKLIQDPENQLLNQKVWILKDLVAEVVKESSALRNEEVALNEIELANSNQNNIENNKENNKENKGKLTQNNAFVETIDIPELNNSELKAILSANYDEDLETQSEQYKAGKISVDEYIQFTENTKVNNQNVLTALDNEKTELKDEKTGIVLKSNLTAAEQTRLQEIERDINIIEQKETFINAEQTKLSTKIEELEAEKASAISNQNNTENNNSTNSNSTETSIEINNQNIDTLLVDEKIQNENYENGLISTLELIGFKNGLRTKISDEIQTEKSKENNTEESLEQLEKEAKRISIEIGDLETSYEQKKEENSEKAKIYVVDLEKRFSKVNGLTIIPVDGLNIDPLKELYENLSYLENGLIEERDALEIDDLDFKELVEKELDLAINNVQNKRRQISIEIGDLESIADNKVVTEKVASEKQIEKLNESKTDYKEQLAKYEADEDKTEKDLIKLVKKENDVIEKETEIVSEYLDQTLVNNESTNQDVLKRQLEIEIESLENVKDDIIKNEKLKEIQSIQNELLSTISAEKNEQKKEALQAEIAGQSSAKILQESKGLSTINELVKENDSLYLKRIEIENDIEALNHIIAQNEKKTNEESITNLISALERETSEINNLIEENNTEINKRVSQQEEDNYRGVEPTSLTTEITYEEEVELAKSEEYKTLRKSINSLDQIKYEVKVKNDLLDLKRKELNDLISKQSLNPTAEKKVKIDKTLKDVMKLEADLKLLRSDLGRAQTDIETQLLAVSENKTAIENLLLRDVAPIENTDLIASATAIDEPLGLNIETVKENVEREKEISLENEIPDGIVFRVQIGAFNKPVNKNTFIEFNPLSGEQVRPGLIRYMAGIFASKRDAKIAQSSIRALGYSDAFVVAYCDRERIPVYRAEQLLATGACLSIIKPSQAVLVENGSLTAQPEDANLPIKEIENDQFSYNKSENSASAEAIEAKRGLFFTLQVGVYNRPVTQDKLFNINPLITLRLKNGQIRYSVGIYNSVAEAKTKQKDIIELGINDAFITAYYKGERIGINKAKKLLEEFGEDILENKISTLLENDELVENIELPQPTLPYIEEDLVEYKFVSKERYEEYPAQVMSRYNGTGIRFYYDPASKQISSSLVNKKDREKLLLEENEFILSSYFENTEIKDAEAVELENAVNITKKYILNIKVLGSQLSAAMAEALIALEHPFRMYAEDGATIIKIGATNSEDVLLRIKQNFQQFNVAEMTISVLNPNNF